MSIPQCEDEWGPIECPDFNDQITQGQDMADDIMNEIPEVPAEYNQYKEEVLTFLRFPMEGLFYAVNFMAVTFGVFWMGLTSFDQMPNLSFSTTEDFTFWTSSSIVVVYGISNGLVYLNMKNEDEVSGKYHSYFYNYSRRVSAPAAFLHTALMIYFAFFTTPDEFWPYIGLGVFPIYILVWLLTRSAIKDSFLFYTSEINNCYNRSGLRVPCPSS